MSGVSECEIAQVFFTRFCKHYVCINCEKAVSVSVEQGEGDMKNVGEL